VAVTDNQDILYGVTGQSLYLDAPEGRPSSVTSVTVYEADVGDDSQSETATTGSPAVETSTETTTATAGFGQSDPRSIAVAAPSEFTIGRRYLLTGLNTGLAEWVEVAASLTASVAARHPLHNTYATGSTLASTRMTQAIDATWVADETNVSRGGDPNARYRVRWVYVVGGVTYVRDTYFDLVRYPGDHGVQPQDVDGLAPGWLDRLPTDHRADQGRKLIADAYRAVKLDLHEVWRGDESEANTEVTDELVRYKAIELGEYARFYAGAPDPARAEVAAQRYSSRFDALIRVTSKTPTRNADGAAAVKQAVGLTVR
jgi:hypothetical protein